MLQPLRLLAFLFVCISPLAAQNFTSTLVAYNNLHMDTTDLDSDGDKDLISGGLYCLSWEENRGNGLFVNHVISQLQPEVQAVVGIDLDQDGYQDIISASLSNNAIYWNRNNGMQTFSSTTLNSTAAGPAGLASADFDNDGDIDLAVASYTGNKIFWLRNNGSQSFTQVDLLSNFNGPTKVRTGDMDGDGDQDILASARTGNQIVWLRNNGSGVFSTVNISNSLTAPREVKLRDYDQDGDLDIIYASDLGWGWFRNDATIFNIFPYSTGTGIYSVELADLNNDGHLDFVTANYSSELINYSLNSGNQTFSSGGTIDNRTSYPNQLVCADYNSDGKVDVMCGGGLDIRYCQNSATLSFTAKQVMQYAGNNHGACHGDFDNDGDVDLMEVGFTFMYWYRNESNGEFTPIQLQDNGFSYITTNYGVNIRTADMDGDGDEDAIYTENDNNKISWIENKGNGLFAYHFAASVMGPYSLEPIDFDDDGDMDFVSGSTADDAVYWYENNGSQTFTEHMVSGMYWDPFSVRVFDYDQDGDMDVFSAQGNPTNKLIVFDNDGNNLDFTDYIIDNSAPGINSIDVKDVNGDGDLDLLSASSTDDKISWYESSGGSFPSFTKKTVSTGVDGATYVFGGDYNGDGEMDVISTSTVDKKVSVYINDGSQSFNRINIGNQVDGADFVESGDLDGDGLEEIYATGSTHGIVQIFKSTPFVLPPAVDLTPCGDIFISEYVEGSSYNKAIEIYNPTPNPIDLAPYRILFYANGATTATQTIVPSGILQPNDVWIIAHSLSDLEFFLAADIDATLNFNGDDAIALTKNGDIIDLIGVIGQDPGTAWTGTSGASTLDKTLVRKPEITKGNNIQGSSFDASVEWIVYPIDAYQYIGNHTNVCNGACIPSISISASSTDICAGTSVTFTASVTNEGAAPTYQWKKNGSVVGTNASTFSTSSLADNDIITCELTSNAACAIPGAISSNSIVMNVNVSSASSISISASATSICAGTSVTFTATPINGGTTPIYQWKKNGGNVGTNSSTFNVSTLVNGDIITCVLTSNAACVSNTSSTSNAITMIVQSSVTPSISITASTTTICAGTSVTFTTNAVNGGTTPSFQWKKNGGNVGTNSTTYSSSTLVNGDIITCELTSNATCVSSAVVSSNSISIIVNPIVTPSISISASQTTICASTSVTFTATPVNAGSSPSYQWKKNGGNVGTNSATYTASSWVNGDVITCQLTGSATCGISTVNSNSVTLTVTSPQTPSVSISASSTSICSGTSVTFTASPVNGGSTPTYQWKKNGSNVGTNSATYINSSLVNGDIISLTMTSALACVTQSSANSNSITMTVNSSVTPSVSISTAQTSICSGTQVTFTATPTNGGSAPTYQWKKNGLNAASTTSTFTTSLLNNGDVISCVMTGNASCGSGTVTSNLITMTVTQTVTPSISISTFIPSTCSGLALSISANVQNGGSSPVLNWMINGNPTFTGPSPFSWSNYQDGDVVSCQLTSNATCASSTTANSNNITISITETVTPAISISSSTLSSCENAPVDFTASYQNGGTTPSFLWKVNGSPSGTNSAQFSSSSLANGDVVTCQLTSSFSCVTSSTATSNSLTIAVTPSITPSISISSNATQICSGETVQFTAVATNAGSSPSYAWLLNGNNTGITASNYDNFNLQDNDVVSCQISGNENCIGTAVSTGITMDVTTLITLTINEVGGLLICDEIPGAIYTWMFNTDIIPDAVNSSFQPTQSGLYSVMYELNDCQSATSAEFNYLLLNVHAVQSSEFTVIPNPASQLVEVRSSSAIDWIIIRDAQGREVLKSSQTINNVSHLASGIYWIQAQSGYELKSAKLVIVR